MQARRPSPRHHRTSRGPRKTNIQQQTWPLGRCQTPRSRWTNCSDHLHISTLPSRRKTRSPHSILPTVDPPETTRTPKTKIRLRPDVPAPHLPSKQVRHYRCLPFLHTLYLSEALTSPLLSTVGRHYRIRHHLA